MSLYEVIEWTKKNGEPLAFARLRLRLIKILSKERIALQDVTPETKVSSETLKAAQDAASEIVGRPYSQEKT
jgi:hypothetical protein